MVEKRIAIRGMVDCEGKQVYEDDIVEYLHWCYASQSKWNEGRRGTDYSPLYGIVKWNIEYFTYEPLIFSEDDYNGNCFANVCQYEPPEFHQGFVDFPAIYFKVIGNIHDNPDLLKETQVKIKQFLEVAGGF